MENRIIEVIESLDDMRFLTPADENAVSAAEEALGLRFADEYREYVKKYGVISSVEVELTGVTEAKRLDVVAVTERERELTEDFPEDMYVVENVGIDGILVLQNSKGEIFYIAPGRRAEKVANSLAEYIEMVKEER